MRYTICLEFESEAEIDKYCRDRLEKQGYSINKAQPISVVITEPITEPITAQEPEQKTEPAPKQTTPKPEQSTEELRREIQRELVVYSKNAGKDGSVKDLLKDILGKGTPISKATPEQLERIRQTLKKGGN